MKTSPMLLLVAGWTGQGSPTSICSSPIPAREPRCRRALVPLSVYFLTSNLPHHRRGGQHGSNFQDHPAVQA